MLLFWALIFVNYFIGMTSFPWPHGVPASLYNEALEMLLLLMAIIDIKEAKFESALNTMLAALLIWGIYIALEIFNNTCGMMFDFSNWYPGARQLALQIIYAFLIFTIYINTPHKLYKYLVIWGGLALFSVIWIWKQRYIGLNEAERIFLIQHPTHLIQNGTLIRYFSIYVDAASAGIGMASTSVAFIVFGITSKVKKYKYFFFLVGIACAWGLFPTGTRTAIACLLAGFLTYSILSKSIKISVSISILGLATFFFLAFTNIANGNQMVRRMRSAFNKQDASSAVRDINRETMKKYMQDAPFGIGVGIKNGDLPSNHKFYAMSVIAPDSEYVSIWLQTGTVGLTIFLLSTATMFIAACRIIMFKLTSSSLRGIGAGLTCAFAAVQLGGYGNQVLMQFPNCVVFYGGLSLVYVLPLIEKEWIEHENKLLAAQTERERIKAEKKKQSRV